MSMRDIADLRDGLGRREARRRAIASLSDSTPPHDHQNAYAFEVNASGVQNDYLQVDDTRTNNDYEAVWEVATLHTATGWNAEFGSRSRRCAFRRRRAIEPCGVSRSAVTCLCEASRTGGLPGPVEREGTVSRFGHLIFDDRLTPPRRLEFTPYALGQMQTKSGAAASDASNAGFDLASGTWIRCESFGDRESRFRPGRGRPVGVEPVGVRDVLPREAAVLCRRQSVGEPLVLRPVS